MAEAAGPALQQLEATLYKGTTLPHIVVKRRCVLQGDGFTTYQVDKGPSTGKTWQLHRKASLAPASSMLIRVHERHLRKAGPLRALSAYARDKNVLKLYCFRVEWADKYAPAQGSSVELGFDTLVQAQEWHEALTAIIANLAFSLTGTVSRQHSLLNGSLGSHAGLAQHGVDGSVEPSPFTSPVASFPPTPQTISKSVSMAGIDSGSSPPPGQDGSYAPPAAGDISSQSSAALNGGSDTSSRHHGHQRTSSSSAAAPGAPAPGGTAAGGGSEGAEPAAAGVAAAAAAAAAAPCGAVRTRRTDARSGDGGAGSSGGGPRGVVVDERMVRWVPYKHANGMAIYYRQTPAEEGMPQASGEYMLSTAVQASPECCVSNLMLKADKSGSILSTAAFMEVLEDNGDMQVWHMVFHPAGTAGVATVLAAPRYTFMHQVLTSYEEGVYAVLFSSVPDEDVKPEWVERARARTQRAHRAVLRSDPGSGSRRALWKTPVRCNITGAITLSALEGRSGRDSPQTLVTCIVRADWGGWLSSKSAFYSLGQSLGLQEALMDRVLMRVMILKEDVEYSRFKTKPFQLLMVQQEDYDSHAQKQQQQASSASQQQQQQQQAALQQHHSAAAAAAAAAMRQSSNAAASAYSPSSSGCLPGSLVAAPPAASGAAGGAADSGSASSRSAAAAAAAAAARVSAAASALAAHMTNPQQLWNETRGSGSGFRSRGQSSSSTPPRSPLKSAAAAVAAAAGGRQPGSPSSLQQQSDSGVRRPKFVSLKGTVSAPDGVLAAQAWAAAGRPAAPAAARSEQQQGVGSAEESSSSRTAAADRSTPQQQQHASTAPAPAPQQQEQQDEDAEAFSDSADTGAELPYTESQLEAMIGGTLNRRYWEAIHDGPGTVRDVYSIRGQHYLRDRKKIPAGRGRYKLMAADLVATHSMMDHIGRFLPSVRMNGAAFSFVVDLIINYGNPVLHLVMVFSTDRHPNSLGPCPDDPLDAGDEWTPFDFTMSRFLHGSDEERNGMFKLIPHCAKGSWVVSQSVGTTPVILGRKLATTYHTCDRYIEVDVDVASTPAVSYIVKMVQGATKSMLIDHAYLLESHFEHELPEALIGAIRYKHLDMTDYTFISVDQELPFSPVVPGIVAVGQ